MDHVFVIPTEAEGSLCILLLSPRPRKMRFRVDLIEVAEPMFSDLTRKARFPY